jgi:hypothetical protein
MKYYTGIGSRETPVKYQEIMRQIANRLAIKGYVLRSGGADGADTAFENGAGSSKEIYIPWNGFRGKYIKDGYIVPPLNTSYVNDYHPAPHKLTKHGILLMSRNAYQVLGADLCSPSEFVICWTKDGKASGGTGQAIRLAIANNIPVYNLKNEEDRSRMLVDIMKRGDNE